MQTQRSLLSHILEAVDSYRAEREQVRHADDPARPSSLKRVLRWLTPNGGTILLIMALILTQRVWARSLLAPAYEAGPSATTVSYQGRLADAEGNPLTQDGVTLQFSLWDASAGGNHIWPDTGTETHVVDVVDGLFAVGLGSVTPGGIPTSTWSGDRYLEIIVGSETLSPRELIRSVPIAGMALTVPDGAITREKLDPMAATVWLAPPLRFIEEEPWDDVSPVWDISGLLLEAGVPEDADVLLLGWQTSVVPQSATFRFLDAGGAELGSMGARSHYFEGNTWSPTAPQMNALNPVPGATRSIELAWLGAHADCTHCRRMLVVYGWR